MPPKKNPKEEEGGGEATGKDAELINMAGEKLIMTKLELSYALSEVHSKGEQVDELANKNEELKTSLQSVRDDAADIYYHNMQKLDEALLKVGCKSSSKVAWES